MASGVEEAQELEVEVEVKVELELGLLGAAPLDVGDAVHKPFIKLVHSSSLHKLVHN